MKSESKSIVLCADDFGLSAPISEGILALLELQRLSAVSCMTCLADWKEQAKNLHKFKNQAAIGLHFNLTESDSAQPLGRLMLNSLTGKLDLNWVRDQINRQLDDFEDQFGYRPEYVDGHQHVHIFPGIRSVLLATLKQRYPNETLWLRGVKPAFSGHDSFAKAVALRVMGFGFSSQAKKASLSVSRHFAGLYSLKADADFSGFLHGWIDHLPDGGLIMCHPGLTGRSSTGMALTRQQEWDYLASDLFLNRLSQQSATLSKTPSLN